MIKNIYVGNLPWSASEEQIRGLFEEYGTVSEVSLITDRSTGQSRGFAFVKMEASEAAAAIEGLNGREIGGRALRVNEAREREGGGGGGGGGRGGDRGRGRGGDRGRGGRDWDRGPR